MGEQANGMMNAIAEIIVESAQQQRKDFRDENYILGLCCESPDAEPGEIAEQYARIAKGAPKTDKEIIRIFRQCRIPGRRERPKFFRQAVAAASHINDVVSGKVDAISETVRSELDSHRQIRRIALIRLGSAWKDVLPADAFRALMRMNADFAGACLDSIVGLIDAHTGPSEKKTAGRQLSPEAYEEEIIRLNVALNRANHLVQRLQDSYEEQMLQIRAEEEVRMMSMLNSEKYGHILDLVLAGQAGFRALKKKGTLPFEIKNVQSLLRRLMEFTEDCGIVPMLQVGDQISVRAADLEGFSYDGTPFADAEEVKEVEVVSPGWRQDEKDITISYPRVREIQKED